MKKDLGEQNKDQQMKLVVCTPQAQIPQVLTTFLQQFKDPTLVQTPVPKFLDIYDAIAEEVGAMVLMTVLSKDDLPEVLQLLAKLEPRLVNGTHKIVVYNQLNNEKLVALLKAKGVFEVLEPNISLKAFQYKFNKGVQLLHQAVKKFKTNQANAGHGGIGGKGAGEKRAKGQAGQVNFVDPIEHFSDFWLLMNPKHVRFVIGKWFINFYGPGPGSGEWVQHPEQKNGEQGWVWNPKKPEDDTWYKTKGRWVFFGNCPEFSWEEKHWYFISKAPQLLFYNDKEVLHHKVLFKDNGDLDFRQNSRTGKNLQGQIEESIEASITLNDSLKTGKDDKIENDDDAVAFDSREKKPQNKEYRGRFSEQFEERKKKHDKNYENSELKLGLVAKNGLPLKNQIGIELVELREKYVVLDVPAGMLQVDDQIELEAKLVQGGVEKKVAISAATQIVETEDEEDALNSIDHHTQRSVAICELNDKIAPQFIELVQTFKNRREEMTDFFTKAKGAA